MSDPDAIETEVRRYYAGVAVTATGGAAACCDAEADCFGAGLYDTLEGVPDAAALASIGCGNPIAVADLHPGEVVLDLGSGGGIDVLLSARRVGTSGKAYGVDFTPEMLDLARRNAAEAGATNVEFLEGRIEAVPLPDGSVDVVISNCVINLSVDKAAVFAEMHRLLRLAGLHGRPDRRHLHEDDVAERVLGVVRDADPHPLPRAASGAAVLDAGPLVILRVAEVVGHVHPLELSPAGSVIEPSGGCAGRSPSTARERPRPCPPRPTGG